MNDDEKQGSVEESEIGNPLLVVGRTPSMESVLVRSLGEVQSCLCTNIRTSSALRVVVLTFVTVPGCYCLPNLYPERGNHGGAGHWYWADLAASHAVLLGPPPRQAPWVVRWEAGRVLPRNTLGRQGLA